MPRWGSVTAGEPAAPAARAATVSDSAAAPADSAAPASSRLRLIGRSGRLTSTSWVEGAGRVRCDATVPGRVRPDRPAGADASVWCGSATGPLLVVATVAGPDLHGRAVGGAVAGDVQAQPGLDPDHRAVGVHLPLLVGAGGAGGDVHPGTGAGGVAGHVQALGAVHRELVARRQRPLLV